MSAVTCNLGIIFNALALAAGAMSIVAGATLWGNGPPFILAIILIFLMTAGCFIIIVELFHLPGLLIYLQCHQTMWGRVIFFTFLGCLAYMTGDVLHVICMIIILVVAAIYLVWALFSALTKQQYGVPPPLAGYRNQGTSGQSNRRSPAAQTTTTTTTTKEYAI